jgi:hypothetical protein
MSNLKDKSTWGLFGPFENSDDVNKFWYQVRLDELKESIQQSKEGMEEEFASEKDKAIYLEDIKNDEKEIKQIFEMEEVYRRLIEKYKRDKTQLKEIIEDWEEFNWTLYKHWCKIQSMMFDGNLGNFPTQEDRESNNREYRFDELKKDEIFKRLKSLVN